MLLEDKFDEIVKMYDNIAANDTFRIHDQNYVVIETMQTKFGRSAKFATNTKFGEVAGVGAYIDPNVKIEYQFDEQVARDIAASSDLSVPKIGSILLYNLLHVLQGRAGDQFIDSTHGVIYKVTFKDDHTMKVEVIQPVKEFTISF